MRLNRIILLAAVCVSSVGAQGATPREALLERLGKMQSHESVAFGHDDDTAYGHNWKYIDGASDVLFTVGDYPGVINWDLGLIEWGTDEQLDGVPFEWIRKSAAAQHERGGINTLSWHLRNPVTKGDSWDTTGGNVVRECITEGTLTNDSIKIWLGRAADFIGSLRDKDGNRIPVVFRPWHEHTGDWFWWCQNVCEPEDYIALWHLTRQVFDQKGIDNVVWAYSPDKENVANDADYMARYPGDEYIDVFGADVYYQKDTEQFNRWMTATLGAAARQAKAHGKIAALTETGCEGVKVDNWFTEVLMPAIEPYDIAYITVWRNAWDKPTHFYAPFPGHKSVPDFKGYYNSPKSAFARDLKKIK